MSIDLHSPTAMTDLLQIKNRYIHMHHGVNVCKTPTFYANLTNWLFIGLWSLLLLLFFLFSVEAEKVGLVLENERLNREYLFNRSL